MPEQLLDRPDVVPVLKQMRREAVPQRVAVRRHGRDGLPHRRYDRHLDHRFVWVVLQEAAISRISAESTFSISEFHIYLTPNQE